MSALWVYIHVSWTIRYLHFHCSVWQNDQSSIPIRYHHVLWVTLLPCFDFVVFFQLKWIFKNLWIFKYIFLSTMALVHYKLMRFFQNSSLYPPQELRQCWLCRHTVAYTNKHADELQNAPQLKWPRIRSESRRDASLSERIINAHHTYKHTPALSGSHSLSHSSPSSFQFTLSLPVTSLTFF